jgi:hypothetical protein
MNEEQAARMLEFLEQIDWKLWEIMKMMNHVLGPDEDTASNDDN